MPRLYCLLTQPWSTPGERARCVPPPSPRLTSDDGICCGVSWMRPGWRSIAPSRRPGRGDGPSFIPWPESLLADADLRAGDVDAAAAGFEHAFALGCQIGDPCWESIAARGLGLVAAARGNGAAALEWLEDAVHRCRRLPDSWLWVEAYALEALCRVAVDNSAPSSSRWIAELEVLAAKAGLRELLARATMHRARLGDAGADEAATFLAAGIDNPALIAELAASIASSS